jgi:hypothetical protein
MAGEKMSEFPEINDTKKLAYLVEYSRSGSHAEACKVAGVTAKTSWNWRHDNRSEYLQFQQSLEVARQILVDRLEATVFKRATEGGSDSLLMFLLKKHDPSYRENYKAPSVEQEAIQAASRECFQELKENEMLRINDVHRFQKMLA